MLCGGGDVPVDVIVLNLLEVSEFVLVLDSVVCISVLDFVARVSVMTDLVAAGMTLV
jgi:hypothetical protein